MPEIAFSANTGLGHVDELEDGPLYKFTGSNAYSRTTTIIGQQVGGGDDRGTLLLRLSDAGLAEIPAGSTIDSVQIELYATYGLDATKVFELFRSLRAWGLTTCTYTTYDGSNAWGADGSRGSGTDFDATASYSDTYPVTGAGWRTFSSAGLAADLQDMLDGVEANNGWVPLFTSGSNGGDDFVTGRGTDGQRPIIRVNYTAGGPTERDISATLSLAAQQARTVASTLSLAVQRAVGVAADLDLAVQQARSVGADISLAVRAGRALAADLSVPAQAGRTVSALLSAAAMQDRALAATLSVAPSQPHDVAADLSLAIQRARTVLATLSVNVATPGASLVAADLSLSVQAARAATATLSLAVARADAVAAQLSLAVAISGAVTADLSLSALAQRAVAATLSVYAAGDGPPPIDRVPPWMTPLLLRHVRAWGDEIELRVPRGGIPLRLS